MGKLRNPMKVAEAVRIDARYDVAAENMVEVVEKSTEPLKLFVNAFRLGYVQGTKAAKAKMRKTASI